LVEIDITRPLLHKILLESPNGKGFEQKIEYDWEPTFCKKFQQVEHACEAKQLVQPETRPRKDWIPKKKVVVTENGKQPSKQLGISNDDDDEWNVPKKSCSKQYVGGQNTNKVPIANSYEFLPHEDTILEQINECETSTARGGDHIPFVSL